MNVRLKKIAEAIGANVVGDDGVEITGVASIASGNPGDIVFAEEEKQLQLALNSAAAAVITGEFAKATKTSKPLVLAAHPRLAFARAAQLLAGKSRRQAGIHSSAVVLPSAAIAESAIIDPWTFVGEHTSIGARTWIGVGAVIGSGAVIGQDCEIYPRVTIYPGTRIGNHVIIHAGAVLGSDGFGYVRNPATGGHEKFPQIGQLIIEDDVEIGANTAIDRGALETTRIGRGTKIDNLVHVGHNCQIGENVIIAAQVGIAGSAVIEDNAVLGGQVGIAEHVHIQEGVILGAQAGVPSKKIVRGKGVAFWGTPARPLREYLKQLAAISKLAKKE